MELRVLGPVEAIDDVGEHRPLALGGARPRTIVAALALGGGPVSSDRLIHEVWRDAPPPSATGTLHSYVSRLRRALGRHRLAAHRAGYVLTLARDELDVDRFERALVAARAARDAGRRDDAVVAYDAALDLWRGEVAEGLDPGTIILGAAARLQERRLLATEERVEVLLSAGRHHEVVGELEALVGSHPHRERLHAQRLVALYRAGRQADALEAYREARDLLVASLGIEPGPQLRELHRRLLDQDPSLGVHAAMVPDAVVVVDGGAAGGVRRPIGNLPAPLATFVGRVAARRDIAARLAGDARLVTLVGAGGCGKTQLALRVAADASDGYPQGVWWVELAAHQDPDRVVPAAADVLGVGTNHAVDRLEQVARRLGTGRQLLILDNGEHLVDACADLASELLRRCPDLRILATSREPLDVDGEQVWRVPSLGLPGADDPPDRTLASEAAQLLALRGREVRPDLAFGAEDAPIVGRVCRELDGIPLALELAAARLNVLSLNELADRLRDRFAVLAHGRRSAPARHRTLEAAIAWSYDLLGPSEQRLLTRLTVFTRGCSVDDAEVVCRDVEVFDLLAALVDKSLVQRTTDPDGRARLDLLVTVQSFASRRADPDDLAIVARRHAEHYTAVAERAAPELTGPHQVDWLNRLHLEQGNLRSVLERKDRLSARVAAAVWWFWLQFGHAVEGDRWMRELFTGGLELEDQPLGALHRGAARLAVEVDEPVRAVDHLDVALEIFTRQGATSQAAQDQALRARILAGSGENDEAGRSLGRARDLAGEVGDAWTRAVVEHQAAVVAWHADDLDAASEAATTAEAGFRAVGDRWTACLARLEAARIARLQGRRDAAASLHRTNLRHGLELTVSSFDFVGLPQDLQGLALLAIEDGRAELATTLLGTVAALRTAVELPGSTAARHDELVRRCADDLDRSTFERAFVRGRQGSAEHAVQLALALTEDGGPTCGGEPVAGAG